MNGKYKLAYIWIYICICNLWSLQEWLRQLTTCHTYTSIALLRIKKDIRICFPVEELIITGLEIKNRHLKFITYTTYKHFDKSGKNKKKKERVKMEDN